jgi:hypothetical protein
MPVPFRVRAVQCPDHRLFVAGSAIMVLIAVTFQTNIVHAQAFRGRGPWCTAYFDGSSGCCSRVSRASIDSMTRLLLRLCNVPRQNAAERMPPPESASPTVL